jgi:hypothetical protein
LGAFSVLQEIVRHVEDDTPNRPFSAGLGRGGNVDARYSVGLPAAADALLLLSAGAVRRPDASCRPTGRRSCSARGAAAAAGNANSRASATRAARTACRGANRTCSGPAGRTRAACTRAAYTRAARASGSGTSRAGRTCTCSRRASRARTARACSAGSARTFG